LIVSFAAALAAALAFGVASLLQEDGARRSPVRRDVGFGLLGALLRQPAFVLGTALDAAGFVLTFVALRRLPLFAVEATVSSAIAVTAIGAARRGQRLGRTGRFSVVAGVFGLTLIGSSALPEGPPTISSLGRLALLAGVPALAAAGFGLGRAVRGPVAAPALGALAGLAFALFSVAGRVLPHAPYVQDPLAWAALAYVALGVLLYGAALQRGPVTVVMASTTVVETVLPALAGLALADGARAGLGPVAALGFVLTTVATLALVRTSRNNVPGCPESAADVPFSPVSVSSSRIGAPLTTS
jgi:drug/metabolite transporter (DMT)-like permease